MSDDLDQTEDEGELARINALLYEANRLDDIAYGLFADGCRDVVLWRRFNEIKFSADAMRTQAYQAWMRLHRKGLRSSDFPTN